MDGWVGKGAIDHDAAPNDVSQCVLFSLIAPNTKHTCCVIIQTEPELGGCAKPNNQRAPSAQPSPTNQATTHRPSFCGRGRAASPNTLQQWAAGHGLGLATQRVQARLQEVWGRLGREPSPAILLGPGGPLSLCPFAGAPNSPPKANSHKLTY